MVDAGPRILAALALDRYGIAYANLRSLNRQVKSIAIAANDDGPYYEGTKENLVERKYPLTRAVTMYVNRAPGQALDPTVKEFLRYVLSPEGQREVAQDRDFLPLSQATAAEQIRKIE